MSTPWYVYCDVAFFASVIDHNAAQYTYSHLSPCLTGVMLLLTSVFSWAREFYVSETKLQYGMHSFGSVRGVSGHVHNPFAGKQ
jgi:alpha-galactosidase